MRAQQSTGPAGVFRALVGLGTVVAFLFAFTLAAAPGLHEHLHTDAATAQHECAVTIIGAGKFQLTDSAPAVAPVSSALPFSAVATLHPVWVPSPFLGACIFEHAPPALS
jgi:hypothetical protein